MKPSVILLVAFLFASFGLPSQAHGQGTSASPVSEPAPMLFPPGTSIESVYDTGNKAILNLFKNFSESRHAPGAKSFILLPLAKDTPNQYFSQQFETELTQHFADKGLKVYTRDNKTLTQIFDFTAWAQTFPEAIDEKTLQSLGGIVDAPAIISPRLDITVDERGTITARANMRIIVRRTAGLPPGVSEGYAQMKAIPTNAELLTWGGYALAAIILLVILRKVSRAVGDARRPR